MLRRTVLAVAILLVPLAAVRAEDRYFESNGVRIHYVVQGKGEPVLLIHGFAASVPVQWGLPGVLNALAKDYQVIALDNRGHGRSAKPHDAKKYGLEMVEDSVRLLDHLKIKKAHVVGYSMGAIITHKLMTIHPERVLSATLGGASGLREDSEFEPMALLADDLEQGKGIGRLLNYLTPDGKPKPSENQLKFVNQMLMTTNDPKALAAVVRGWRELVIPEAQLKANKIPALALIGELDPLKKGVDALDGRMASLRTVVIEGADHMTAFRQPEFLLTLRAFLAENGEVKKARKPAVVGAEK